MVPQLLNYEDSHSDLLVLLDRKENRRGQSVRSPPLPLALTTSQGRKVGLYRSPG